MRIAHGLAAYLPSVTSAPATFESQTIARPAGKFRETDLAQKWDELW